MGGGKKKRAADEISPDNKHNKGQNKRQTKMAFTKNTSKNSNKNTSQHGMNLSQQKPTTLSNQSAHQSNQHFDPANPKYPASQAPLANQSYSLPPVYQYPPHYMGLNSVSPVFSQSTPQFNNASMPQGNNDTLQTILERLESLDSRLESMDGRLIQLDSISLKVNSITRRLDLMEKKINDLEVSQNFLGNRYDDVSKTAKETSQSVKSLESKVLELEAENDKISQEKESLKDDIIDLKCRSMRENMLFFGLPETNGSMVTPNFASGSIQSSHVSFDPNPDPNVLSENCEEKIFQFCEKVLKIENVKASVEIDTAHRIGGRVQDKADSC